MPLLPVPLFPVNTDNVTPEDLPREVDAVHVHATVERFTYLNSPRRPFTWRIFLKLNGGKSTEDETWDVVEIVKKPDSPEAINLATVGKNIIHSPVAENTEIGGGAVLRFMSMPYPEYGNPFSCEESRFVCALAATPRSAPASSPATATTVQSVINVLLTHSFNHDAYPNTDLGRSAKVWDTELGEIGELKWVLDVVRTLVSCGLIGGAQADKLCADYAASPSRYELAEGSTIIV